jgi:hypothetical protein
MSEPLSPPRLRAVARAFDLELTIEPEQAQVEMNDHVVDLEGRHAALGLAGGPADLENHVVVREERVAQAGDLAKAGERAVVDFDPRVDRGHGAIHQVDPLPLERDEPEQLPDLVVGVLAPVDRAGLEDGVASLPLVLVGQDVVVGEDQQGVVVAALDERAERPGGDLVMADRDADLQRALVLLRPGSGRALGRHADVLDVDFPPRLLRDGRQFRAVLEPALLDAHGQEELVPLPGRARHPERHGGRGGRHGCGRAGLHAERLDRARHRQRRDHRLTQGRLQTPNRVELHGRCSR